MKQKAEDLISRCFSKGPMALVIAVLILLALLMGIVNMKKTVSVVIDGKEKKIVTYRSQLDNILKKNDICIGKKDKISKKLDTKVKDGDKIYIKKAIDIKVKVDGKILNIKTAENNIGDMLKAEGIKIDKDDKVNPSNTEKINEDLLVSIARVEYKVLKEAKPVEFSTVMKKDDTLEKNKRKVIQNGAKGQKVIATKVTYQDGKEVSRKVVSESVTKKPVSQIVAIGTLGVIRPSRGGSYNYKRSLKVKATAYTSSLACTGKYPGSPGFGITATGTKAKRNSRGYSTIAVDPRVIPLGTKVYVEGYGLAIAEDVGGAIKGSKIDVYLNSESQARNWGVKWVNIYVLK
ncbi:3D domain-containing protein [Haloimpatiens sp. FM7330]|uniref:3D domain-containing protein n=1 Tax=Haloimpatiens sp. FM7330 TaxID=3298610 RepID=UPI00362D9A40